jgi:hypothetical protein
MTATFECCVKPKSKLAGVSADLFTNEPFRWGIKQLGS